MGNNLVSSKSKQTKEREYIYPGTRINPFTLDELNQVHYKTVMVDNFKKNELLKKYIDTINLNDEFEQENINNFNKIIKMMNYCETTNNLSDNIDNYDCMCNQNLNICFVKQMKVKETYKFLEYVNNPSGRVFLRIY